MHAGLDPFGGNDGYAAIRRRPGVGAERLAPVEELRLLLGGDLVGRPIELHFAKVDVAVLPLKHQVDLRALLPL